MNAIHAHRLWINLWTSLGHPAENSGQPGGNAMAAERRRMTPHRSALHQATGDHSPCALAHRRLPARTLLIHGIHRPYDDYRTRYGNDINTQVGPGAQRGRPTPLCRQRSNAATITGVLLRTNSRPAKEGDR